MTMAKPLWAAGSWEEAFLIGESAAFPIEGAEQGKWKGSLAETFWIP